MVDLKEAENEVVYHLIYSRIISMINSVTVNLYLALLSHVTQMRSFMLQYSIFHDIYNR
jgi:hypothetical protein